MGVKSFDEMNMNPHTRPDLTLASPFIYVGPAI